MKKISKVKGICSFALISASCLMMAFAVDSPEKVASASATEGTTATAEEFKLQGGAGLWIGNETDSGIRFLVDVKESYIKSFDTEEKDVASIKYWTIVAPADKVENAAELTVDNYAGYDGGIINASTTPSFNETDGVDETFTYTASIKYDFSDSFWTEERQQAMIDLPLVARPCLAITYEDGTYDYVYASLDGTQSQKMRDVAERVMLAQVAGEEKTYTEEQFDKILWYLKTEDTNAYHEQNDTAIDFIDSTAYADMEVYQKVVEGEGDEAIAKFEKISASAIVNEGNDGKTTLTEESVASVFADVALGTQAETEIYLCNGTEFVKTNVTEVTKIIYTLDDLKIFDFKDVVTGPVDKIPDTETDETELAKWKSYTHTNGKTQYYKLAPRMVEGYYVLGNNIKDTSFIINQYSYNWMWNYYGLAAHVSAKFNGRDCVEPPYYATTGTNEAQVKANSMQLFVNEVGFHGTFDGLGHTLTIKTNAGLFYMLQAGSTVKNVNFKDCIAGLSTDQNYNSLMGSANTKNAVEASSVSYYFENINITLDKTVYETVAENGYSMRILPIVNANNVVNTRNVVFEFDWAYVPTESTKSGTIYFSQYQLNPVATGTWNTCLVEKNKVDSTDYKVVLDLISWDSANANTSMIIQDMETYYDTEAGQTALAKFDTTYWDVSAGYPVWREAAQN